jgi:glycosyltransferase involved in cell wall biosynthesis
MTDVAADIARVKRVMIVHNSADLYGASRSLIRLSTHLLARHVTPYVVLPEEGALAARLRDSGVSVAIEPTLSVITRDIYRSIGEVIGFMIRVPRSAWRIRKLARLWKVDVIHTNTGVILSPALGAWMARIPHVWHVRDWFQEFRRIWPAFDRYVRWFSARVICVSGAVAGQFSPDPKVVVVNNGFPLEEFDIDAPVIRQHERGRLGLSNDVVIIGVVGRIKFVRKGQEILVAAAKLLKDRGMPFRVLIVGGVAPGNEDHRTRLESLIGELGLADDVLFAGEVADPRPSYAAMDIVVLPSAQPEPFGGVVIEAMAMRRPVVATAIGGSLEQVADGVTGYLVPPADPMALADRLAVLIADPARRLRFGAAGRQRVEDRFTVDRMVNSILSIYTSVSAGRFS